MALFQVTPTFPTRQAAGRIALFRAKSPSVPNGASFETRAFANLSGSRTYKVYVPSDLPANAPVVVMLHGCTQNPDDFATGTRMNEIAEAQKFLVVYPGQPSSANAQNAGIGSTPASSAGRAANRR